MNEQMNTFMDSFPRSTPSPWITLGFKSSGSNVITWNQSVLHTHSLPEPENPSPEKMQHDPPPISKLDHKSLWEKLSLSPLSPWFLAQSCIQNSCLMEGKTIGWLWGSSKWTFWNQKFSSRLNHQEPWSCLYLCLEEIKWILQIWKRLKYILFQSRYE